MRIYQLLTVSSLVCLRRSKWLPAMSTGSWFPGCVPTRLWGYSRLASLAGSSTAGVTALPPAAGPYRFTNFPPHAHRGWVNTSLFWMERSLRKVTTRVRRTPHQAGLFPPSNKLPRSRVPSVKQKHRRPSSICQPTHTEHIPPLVNTHIRRTSSLHTRHTRTSSHW